MNDIVSQIHCHKCNSFFPQTEEYFRRNRHGNISSPCKVCIAITKRAYRQTNPDKVAADKKRDYEKRKDAISAYHKQWRLENIERVREYQKQYSLDHAEEYRLRSAIWYSNNKKRASLSNAANYQRKKETKKAYVREWVRKNPEKAKASAKASRHNRRAREISAEGVFTTEDILIAYRSQRGRCWHCGCKVDKDFHADHLVSLKHGGTNWPNNMVVSCSDCNLSKGGKFCWQWNGKLF